MPMLETTPLRSPFAFVCLCLLVACGDTDGVPPRVSIAAPSVGASLTGTVAVQINAVDDDRVTAVRLYARAPGSTKLGPSLGSATSTPYVIALNTAILPNATDVELVATATDASGASATSDPVRVRAQNTGAPKLLYLVAFTLPRRDTTAPLANTARLLPAHTSTLGVQGPPTPPSPSSQPAVTAAAADDVTFNAEWAWNSVDRATGYKVYLASELAGPYALQYAQQVGATGEQKYARELDAAREGTTVFGAVTALRGENLAEGALSNADGATFLGPQRVTSPPDEHILVGGRPTLAWSRAPGASRSLFWLYDKNPWEPSARVVWTNFPNATTAQSASYPAGQAPLPPGTYHWWVAGVRFDAQGDSDAFSFSAPRKLVVP